MRLHGRSKDDEAAKSVDDERRPLHRVELRLEKRSCSPELQQCHKQVKLRNWRLWVEEQHQSLAVGDGSKGRLLHRPRKPIVDSK